MDASINYTDRQMGVLLLQDSMVLNGSYIFLPFSPAGSVDGAKRSLKQNIKPSILG